MRLVTGKYNSAKVFTDNMEDSCIEQIRGLLDQDAFGGAQIRIMPDCHWGKGCVIGFTADLGDKIIPNIVGVDIGCGMMTLELGKLDLTVCHNGDCQTSQVRLNYHCVLATLLDPGGTYYALASIGHILLSAV